MSLRLILLAIALSATSGLPGLCMARSSVWGQRIAAAMMCGSAILGLSGAGSALIDGPGSASSFPWPAAMDFMIGVDALAAFFLFPIFLMGALGAIYGLGYWTQPRHPGSARRLAVFWGLLVAGMAMLVISRHALGFLLGWEVMALSAFFLIVTEDHRRECRRAGLVYLVATHVGTLTLFALFSLWRRATGSYAMEPAAADSISGGMKNGLFFLALLAFGLKAGMMPFHFWLPDAHASAPSHVSAMLSGVVLKMGIYGLVRWLWLLPDPPGAWGGLVLMLGAISGLFGVVLALGQHDLKRLLAYHSVENIGIILMGLGLAMLGRSAGRPEWIVLGMAGCLLHVWNHGLFKSLLFLCAGSVVHRTHTRQIDRLGGLARTMPWTSAMFLVGAVAICGLPPLNGFVSELFVYLGLIRTLTQGGAAGSAAVVAAPVLALIGALAVACFVKAYGAVFLGTPRGRGSMQGRESPVAMLGPMVVLAGLCGLIGLAPGLTGRVLDNVIAGWKPEGDALPLPAADIVPLDAVGAASASLLVCAGILALALAPRARAAHGAGTWDCGYACTNARMQYTASSFADTLVGMFGWALRPRMHWPHLAGLFPPPTSMSSHVDDPVLDRLLVPAGRKAEQGFGWFHRFQQGLTQYYVLYILITVILMLGTLIPIEAFFREWFSR